MREDDRVRVLFSGERYEEGVIVRIWPNGVVDVKYAKGGTDAALDPCRIEVLTQFELIKVGVGACAVLFLRYIVATFLSAFFPQRAARLEISNTVNGFIFAAYPMGIALASLFAPRLLQVIGQRPGIVFGLIATGFFTIAFGLVPDAMGGIPVEGVPLTSLQRAQQWAFLILYFLNGLIGSLAENGALMLITEKTRVVNVGIVGRVMATIGMVTGIGCMTGPPLGGLLNHIGGLDDAWQFRMPFLVFGILPVICSLACPFLIPAEPRMPRGGDDSGGAAGFMRMQRGGSAAAEEDSAAAALRKRGSLCSVLSISSVTTLLALAINGGFVASLDPTLALRLGAATPFTGGRSRTLGRADVRGFGWSETTIGLYFMMSSILYTLISIPLGWVIDTVAGNSCVLKLIQAAGFACLAASFFLLGPGYVPGVPSASDAAIFRELNHNVPSIVFAMVLKGLGSAGNNAAYCDLIVGVSTDNPYLTASISSLWNGAYAIGWAFGPLLGGILYEFGPRIYATAIYISALACCAVLIFTSFFRCSAPLEKARTTDGSGSGEQQQHGLDTELLGPSVSRAGSMASVSMRTISSAEVYARTISSSSNSLGRGVFNGPPSLSAGGGRALTWAHHIIIRSASAEAGCGRGSSSGSGGGGGGGSASQPGGGRRRPGQPQDFHAKWNERSLTRYTPNNSLNVGGP